ncbi:MAG: AbrB/MazE/SpoVT family DNA-binding domain-containing protein [Promethearchaeota archaeon]|nr:MAG: AbrB/MazE/SpoVT family DNA-binding domain-containing protein [Candidatus Lokiarchaeota archaeon]
MSTEDDTKVGKKGEILPKKPLRDISGIKPGDRVLIEAEPGKLVIKKIYSVEEALKMSKIAEGTPESVEKEIKIRKNSREFYQ